MEKFCISEEKKFGKIDSTGEAVKNSYFNAKISKIQKFHNFFYFAGTRACQPTGHGLPITGPSTLLSNEKSSSWMQITRESSKDIGSKNAPSGKNSYLGF